MKTFIVLLFLSAFQQSNNAIVNNQTNYSINNFANKYLEKKYAFKNLREYPDTLQALAIAQPVYQTFYDSVSAATIGNFETVIDSVHQGSFGYAANINNSIVANDTIDVNQKSVIDIYLKTWANGIFEFTQNQYDSLYQIAMQDEATGGFGVYGARVMLGIEPNFMNILKTTAPIESMPTLQNKIYPNPTNNEAYYDFQLNDDQQGMVYLYSITGQLLFTKPINSNENKLVIDLTNYQNGIYFYRIEVDKVIVANDKLIIIK